MDLLCAHPRSAVPVGCEPLVEPCGARPEPGVEPPFNRVPNLLALRFHPVECRFPWNRLPYIVVAPWRNLDGRQRAEGAPHSPIIVSLPGRNSPLGELDSGHGCALLRTGVRGRLPLPHLPRRPLESSTRSVRLVAAFVSSMCSAPPGTRRMGHDCLAVRFALPTWKRRDVKSFPFNTTSPRSSYLLPAPTLLRLNHLADLQGTGASPPATAELPRLADVV